MDGEFGGEGDGDRLFEASSGDIVFNSFSDDGVVLVDSSVSGGVDSTGLCSRRLFLWSENDIVVAAADDPLVNIL
jgi:hypothetical protein